MCFGDFSLRILTAYEQRNTDWLAGDDERLGESIGPTHITA